MPKSTSSKKSPTDTNSSSIVDAPVTPVRKSNKTEIDEVLKAVNKKIGDRAVMRMDGSVSDIPGVSSGCSSLDIVLGGRGYPKGRVVEIYGPESAGKTMLALHAVAEIQKAGGTAAFIDAEHALNPRFAQTIGVNIEELVVSQPDCGEDALQITNMLVESGKFGIVVVDSVAALVPKAELEGDIGDHHVGRQARMMSQAMRMLVAHAAKSETIIIFINQLREKIGVMFGNPETTPGGKALKFYSSIRLDVRKIGAIKEGEVQIGNRVRVKCVKNKIAPPFKQTEFDLVFTEGISREGDLLDQAIATDIIQKAGAWFSYDKNQIGQGREAAKRWLKENQNQYNEIVQKVREKLLGSTT